MKISRQMTEKLHWQGGGGSGSDVMGNFMPKDLWRIGFLAYGFYWYIDGMERKKVRVGETANLIKKQNLPYLLSSRSNNHSSIKMGTILIKEHEVV